MTTADRSVAVHSPSLSSSGRGFGWAVLLALLAANLWGALTFDRGDWPSLVGDEATYAMQAESLAWDFDLVYERGDYDRFVEHWQRRPEGLILQSRDHGGRLVYSKPLIYAVAVAPFVRLAPVRGAPIGNAVWLALAAVIATIVLERRIGSAAPLWVAAFVFGSVAFAYTYWIHADLFLMSMVAVAFALAYWDDEAMVVPDQIYGGDRPDGGWRLLARWSVVGLLLGGVASFRPFYIPLLLPALLAIPAKNRRRAVPALLMGAIAIVAVTAGAQWLAGGNWSSYAGERAGFYERTGFPEVDFPAADWDRSLQAHGNTSWVHEEALDFNPDLRLWLYNSYYFLAGRNVGILPYFLPLLLAFLAFRSDRGRWALPVAVVLAMACFFLVRPFNFWGGRGAIADRYFLPLYPALWFMAARSLGSRRWVSILLPVLIVALSAPFLYSTWTAPRAFPVREDGGFRHVTPLAARWLPHETTQSHIPGIGGPDVMHGSLWVKFLNDGVSPKDDGRSLVVDGGREGELLIGSDRRLRSLAFIFEPGVPSKLEVPNTEAGPILLRPNGGMVFSVLLDEPDYRHPMWWTWDDWFLYRIRLQLPDAAADSEHSFEIVPES